MIRIANLINGEQIIGEFDFSTTSKIIIVNPFYISDAITEAGTIGSKLINVLTFSSTDYIVLNEDKVMFDFPASDGMIKYYNKLKEWSRKSDADFIINEAINEMEESEKRYETLMNMIKPNKSSLN